ncbi:DUF4392 domain-containing protein [Pusillimonas sp. MFBS29]|uniref:glutamate cyclase domain-containing protein n=1 Tax=Pusillimonas sp. MFBS29 TaxID=2886690 RepID=UPI001D110AF8|nr:glutamate cyclase domain-containing protein [Pusillimonas sp. MFBS29]MCC2596255.1 DUF4392 domain-containing protein [Pusillimonas sp. MFBS29]
MSNGASGMWYYEYLDQIVNLELKNKPAQQGGTQLRYRTAREQQGGQPLCGQIAQALLPRLPDSTVILVTGTGNPEWLPHGETDGPSGVAVLARCLGALGVRTCILSEARFLPGVQASVQAAGVPLLQESAWCNRNNAALCLEFPTGVNAAMPFVDELMKRLPKVSAAFFIEKPGPGREGRFHNSSGKPKDSDCACEHGLLDATELDFLFPASVSNWGGYAIAAALALASGRFLLLPRWEEVANSISAPIAFGAFDGYSGLAVPTVDGTSSEANRAVYGLIGEVLRLAHEASNSSHL